MPQYSLSELLTYLEGVATPYQVAVSSNRMIETACSLVHPRPNGISFSTLQRTMDAPAALAKISLLLTSDMLEPETLAQLLERAAQHQTAVVLTPNPRLTFMYLVGAFFVELPTPGIHVDTTIGEDVEIDPSATICAGVRLGDGVKVGARTVICQNATVLGRTTIGKDCYIGPGARLGQPGFGYERDDTGRMVHFPHLGSLIIRDRVEVGANTCIDRGTLDDTVIKNGVKIADLCCISHNTTLNEDVVIAANSTIGGSVSLGSGAWIAPSASIINSVSVGRDTTVGMSGAVTKSVPDAVTVLGVPAVEIETFLQRKRAVSAVLEEFENRSHAPPSNVVNSVEEPNAPR